MKIRTLAVVGVALALAAAASPAEAVPKPDVDLTYQIVAGTIVWSATNNSAQAETVVVTYTNEIGTFKPTQPAVVAPGDTHVFASDWTRVIVGNGVVLSADLRTVGNVRLDGARAPETR